MNSLSFADIIAFEQRVREGRVSLLDCARFAVQQGNVGEAYAETLSRVAVNILGVRKLAPDFVARSARNTIDDRLRLRILTIHQIHDRFEPTGTSVQFEVTITAAKEDLDFVWLVKFNNADIVSVQVRSQRHDRYLWSNAEEIKKIFLKKV